jgi:hypothetical protein
MKQEMRSIIKESRGIKLSEEINKNCKKCLYHNHQKICQIHLLKTRVDDVCDHFTPLKKHKIYRGGGVSPK